MIPSAPVETEAIAYQTVEVFSQIVGRSLTLRDSATPRTDGSSIYAPFGSPDLYPTVERLLAHIVFRTDARALEQLVVMYARAIGKLSALDAGQLRPMIRGLAEALNEHRVIGLWGQLYPGSEIAIRAILHRDTEPVPPPSTVVGLLRAMSGGHEPCGDLERYAPVLKQALDMVDGKSFEAVLLTTKWILNQLVDVILRDHFEVEELPEEVAEDLDSRKQALDMLSKMEAKTPKRRSAVEQPKYPSEKEKSQAVEMVAKTLKAPIKANESTLKELLEAASVDGQLMVTTAQTALKRAKRNDNLRRTAKAKVVFVDVGPMDVADPEPLSDHDAALIRRLRAAAFRQLGRRAHILDYEGTEIDPVAAIQRRVTRQEGPVFRGSRSGRGFRALTLLDRSHSMSGVKTARSERACRIIGKALKFPFVDYQTWGFQGPGPGEVLLTRYAGVDSFTSDKSPLGGSTPLHIAIHVAARHLAQYQDVRQLFVVSDGTPMWPAREGAMMDTEELMELVRGEVMAARRIGIRVTAVFVHRLVHGEIDSELTEEDMEYMFGSRSHWQMIADDVFDAGLIRTVSRSFQSYLRGV